ncbi:MAG: hypothetical protein CSA95_08615 [Bacteroidetes bacterium]|nr:MAG: hypothetical protein CSA95_08615 [Bacteroidota bacterium]
MKRRNFFNMSSALWIMMLAVATIFVGCKDPKPEEEDIVLDGTYIKGNATALTKFDAKGRMTVARNEVLQEDRASLLEKYIAVKATGGFNIVVVKGDQRTVYGPGDNFAEVTELDGDEPTLGLQRGAIAETDKMFTVPQEGLYHVAYDSEVGIVTISRVEWGVIGAATPGGWSGSTQLACQGFDLNTMVFKGTDIVLTKADFKFRYSNGWKVILDPDFDLGNEKKGIKVNANFGGAVNALVPGGDNISNETPGIYTITVTWDLKNGTTASLEKTGDVQVIDYSELQLGLVGNGLIMDGEQHNWDETVLFQLPTVSNETVYTWVWESVEVTPSGSFKIREGQDWNGKVIGYNEVNMAGANAEDFETNGDGNFVPKVDGVYRLELVIDAMTETYTLTVSAAGEPAKLWLPGSYQGWDPGAAPTIVDPENDGTYSGVVDITGEGTILFKFTSQPNWDGTNYGAGETAGTLSADGAAGNLELPEGGSYLFTVDTNALTWTFEKQ